MAIDPQKARASTAEIQKLSERMGRDPASRLFVPLSEEYRKLGQLDRAIETLRSGLKIIPNYTTARVALGRLLLEKGSPAEAREEFEAVLREAPENLLASKKLAEAYLALGMNAEALGVYQRLAALDPFDTESQAALKALEPVAVSKEAPPAGPHARPLVRIDESTRPLPSRPPEPGPSEPPIEKPIENEEEYLGSPVEEIFLQPAETAPEAETRQIEPPPAGAAIPEAPPPSGLFWEEEQALILEEPEIEQPAAAPQPAAADALVESKAPAEEEVFEISIEAIEEDKPPPVIPTAPAPEAVVPSEPPDPDLAAERAVLEGRYDDAREILERCLARDPRNDRVRGRLEDLRFLMDLESRAPVRAPEPRVPAEAPAAPPALGAIEEIVSAAGIVESEPEAPAPLAPPARPPTAAGEEARRAETIAALQSWLDVVRRAKEAKR
ncbi:MAG: hypothetical protein A2V83_09040 [Nitrospirae bacterium RBG_16_64_22]|nr:MAG: hypothetical protein A2V83_09040 [Nitrospirae bacterium RBG_16_64_22]